MRWPRILILGILIWGAFGVLVWLSEQVSK